MRSVLLGALLALPLLTTAASAQKMPAAVPQKEFHPEFDERKYKAATQSIPEQKNSNDPWAGAREPAPAPTADAKPAKTRTKQR